MQDKKVKCPYCGYAMPVFYSREAESRGIRMKCKGRSCGKTFEVKIEKGEQIK